MNEWMNISDQASDYWRKATRIHSDQRITHPQSLFKQTIQQTGRAFTKFSWPNEPNEQLTEQTIKLRSSIQGKKLDSMLCTRWSGNTRSIITEWDRRQCNSNSRTKGLIGCIQQWAEGVDFLEIRHKAIRVWITSRFVIAVALLQAMTTNGRTRDVHRELCRWS